MILSSFPRLREQHTETVAGGAGSVWFLEACSSASWVLAVTKIANSLVSFSTDDFSLNSKMSVIKPSLSSYIKVNKKVFKNVFSVSASFKQLILSTCLLPQCCSAALPAPARPLGLSLHVELCHPFSLHLLSYCLCILPVAAFYLLFNA